MGTPINIHHKILPPVETDQLCQSCGSHLLEVPWNSDRCLWYCDKQGCPAWRTPQGGRKRPWKEDEGIVILPLSKNMHDHAKET